MYLYRAFQQQPWDVIPVVLTTSSRATSKQFLGCSGGKLSHNVRPPVAVSGGPSEDQIWRGHVGEDSTGSQHFAEWVCYSYHLQWDTHGWHGQRCVQGNYLIFDFFFFFFCYISWIFRSQRLFPLVFFWHVETIQKLNVCFQMWFSVDISGRFRSEYLFPKYLFLSICRDY